MGEHKKLSVSAIGQQVFPKQPLIRIDRLYIFTSSGFIRKDLFCDANGYPGRRSADHEEKTPLRGGSLAGAAKRHGLPPPLSGLRAGAAASPGQGGKGDQKGRTRNPVGLRVRLLCAEAPRRDEPGGALASVDSRDAVVSGKVARIVVVALGGKISDAIQVMDHAVRREGRLHKGAEVDHRQL